MGIFQHEWITDKLKFLVLVMTRSAVRICPAAPKNGLSHWDRPFFRISKYSNCRPPARSADSIIYGCFPPAGNIRQFESAQQLQRTVYPIGIDRSFAFLSIRTADLPRDARIQSSTDVFRLQETSGSSNLPSSSKDRFTASR